MSQGYVATSDESLSAGAVCETHYGLAGKFKNADKSTLSDPRNVAGLAAFAVGASAKFYLHTGGVLKGVYQNMNVGDHYWLGSSGGLTTTKPSGSDKCVYIGQAVAADELDVKIRPDA